MNKLAIDNGGSSQIRVERANPLAVRNGRTVIIAAPPYIYWCCDQDSIFCFNHKRFNLVPWCESIPEEASNPAMY